MAGQPTTSAAPEPCPQCGTGWWATHDGAGYAYPNCRCDFQGSTIPATYTAPSGLPVSGSRSPEHPGGLVTA